MTTGPIGVTAIGIHNPRVAGKEAVMANDGQALTVGAKANAHNRHAAHFGRGGFLARRHIPQIDRARSRTLDTCRFSALVPSPG